MEKSSFFNSVAGDRKYKASDFASYFNSLLTNGVFPNPSTNLQVISNNNMTLTVKAGKAWINGYCYINDSDLILPLTVADGVLKRIDRLVIQFNTINRNITAKVKKGTFASSPVALSLQRDADAFELGIADILISNGVACISQSNITDLRMNTTYCGWVNSLIQADTTAIFNQYQAWFTAQSNNYNASMSASELAFNEDIAGKEAQFQSDFVTWFNTIKGQLSGDIAGNLTNLINTNTTKISNLDAQVTKQMNDLKSSVDNGKNGIYSATIGKRITPISKDFSALIAGINAIKLGDGNATGDKVLSSSTFTNADGVLRTGNIPKRGSAILSASFSTDVIVPDGYYVSAKVSKAVLGAGDTLFIKSPLPTGNSDMQWTTYVKPYNLPTLTINHSGTYRISFVFRSGQAGTIVYAKLYKNGIAIGTERVINGWSELITYTEDFVCNVGDYFQCYVKGGSTNALFGLGGLAISTNCPLIATLS